MVSIIMAENSDNWVLFQHDPQHSGFSSSAMPASLERVWITDQFEEPFLRHFAVSEGNLFAAGYSSVCVFDVETGSIIQVCPNIRHGFMFPAISGSKLYLNADSWLYCLDIDTGEMLWHYHEELLNFLSYPIVVDGHVVVGGGEWTTDIPSTPEAEKLQDRAQMNARRVLCINAETGEIFWEFYAKGKAVYSPAYFDGRIFVNDGSKFVHCLNARTGELIWEKIIEWNNAVPLSLDGKRIFVGTDQGIVCLDIKTGETLWGFNSRDSISQTPAAAYDKVFGSAGSILYCIDAQTGEAIWEMEADSHVSTPVIIADGKVAFGTSHGTLYIAGVDSGKVLTSVDLSYDTQDFKNEITTIVLSNGKLIVGQFGGRISCFEESPSGKATRFLMYGGAGLLAVVLLLSIWMRHRGEKA